jgi:hypothetical protein
MSDPDMHDDPPGRSHARGRVVLIVAIGLPVVMVGTFAYWLAFKALSGT